MSNFAAAKTLIIMFATLVLLSGCSRVYVSQDYDTSSPLKIHATYQWLPISMQAKRTTERVEKAYPFEAKRIQKSIMNHMISKGAVFVKKSPEAYISYHYSQSETRSMEPSATIGFGWGSRYLSVRNIFPVNYTEVVTSDATWQVDIYSAKGELIWRGESTGATPVFNTAQESQKHTQSVINKILQQYPPK
ncbi:MAG: hypothetical protein ISEC1_P0720 [Thiomicrorhabdus sp.]|nr:MAG: hypothetical protein ISEC1_P0720 [Thiomicrorhabdus sp.]